MEIMVDIETLDVGQRSVVLSIGVVPFDETGPVADWVILPSVEEQMLRGRTVSLGTVRFWADQRTKPLAVEEAMADEGRRVPVAQALAELRAIFNCPEYRGCSVWANGDIFDLGNIASLFADLGEGADKLPWRYNAPRDLRTVLVEAGRLGWTNPSLFAEEDDLRHTARGDCRWQIRQLLSVRAFYASLVHGIAHLTAEGHGGGC